MSATIHSINLIATDPKIRFYRSDSLGFALGRTAVRPNNIPECVSG